MPSSPGLAPPTPSVIALQHTRFANWFPLYRRHSPKATVIDLLALQPDFLDWLNEDGLVLPLHSDDAPLGSADVQEIDDVGLESVSDDDDADEAEPRDFSALNQRIRQIIDQYDGAVFPKLDWSAPLDAAWMVAGSTLRCTEPSDVYLLLKSSDFVSKDVAQLYELEQMEAEQDGRLDVQVIRPHLVLKKFFSMPTSHEFRCFVRAGRLVCICQRDIGAFFEHLQPIEMQRTLQGKLLDFYNAVLRPAADNSPDIGTDTAPAGSTPFPIADFVWDAYLTRDLSKIFIVDINPYLERTDGLLWAWDEIEEEARQQMHGRSGEERQDAAVRTDVMPSLRLVTSRAQTTQSFPTYAHNMMPTDIVGLSQGTDIADFARQFNEQLAHASLPSTDKEPEVGNESGPGR